MKKILLFSILIMLAAVSYAQPAYEFGQNVRIRKGNPRLYFNENAWIGTQGNQGSTIYYNGIPIGTGVGNIADTDTADMLTNYIARGDTSTMLTPYIRFDSIASDIEIRARGGVSIGVSETKIDSAVYNATTDQFTLYQGADTAGIYVKASDRVEAVAVADSSDGTLGKDQYATSDDLLYGDDPVKVYYEMGSTIKAITFGASLHGYSGGIAMTDGSLRFTAIKIRYTQEITSIGSIITVAGQYTPDNENRVGLYGLNATNDSLILRASSANDAADPNIWEAAASTIIDKVVFATGATKYTAAPGIYWVAVLYNSSAADVAPSIVGWSHSSAAMNQLDFTGGKLLSGYIAAQASFPAKVAMTALTRNSNTNFHTIK